jgi:hypothetical protein
MAPVTSKAYVQNTGINLGIFWDGVLW